MDPKKIKGFFQSRLLDFLFKLTAVAALLVGATASLEARNLSRCQIEYQDYNNTRTRILTENADEERNIQRRFTDAQAALFLDPATLKPVADRTPEEAKRVGALVSAWVQAHQTQREQQSAFDQIRAEHPVPPPPSEFCKG